MPLKRRSFLGQLGLATTTTLLPARWVNAQDLPADRKIKLRFAIASDLHYGQNNTPFDEYASNMVNWINKEQQGKGLDLFFLNGDLVNDKTEMLPELRDKHLSKLQMPYYCIKGNHDYLGAEGSPTESWSKIWGYDSNHTVVYKDYVFVMADTSVHAKSHIYRAADRHWLKSEFDKYVKAPAIFTLIHIQQRKHKTQGWPAHGVSNPEEVPKAEAVMELLESTPNVRGVFHGHNHMETKMWISGERRYFFDSHVGGSWGATKGYRIVEVYDSDEMVSYQVNAEEGGELNRDQL